MCIASALFASGCAFAGGAPASHDDALAEFARLEREAQSLSDRQESLYREFGRIAHELDAWSKRHAVGVSTPQLMLGLLSRSFEVHRAGAGKDAGEFEREYAAIEHAMGQAYGERAAIARDLAALDARLSRFAEDDRATRSQTWRFGDVFLPIPGIEPFAARQPCKAYFGDRGRICLLVEERCVAVDKGNPLGGWDQTCTYVCRKPEMIQHL